MISIFIAERMGKHYGWAAFMIDESGQGSFFFCSRKDHGAHTHTLFIFHSFVIRIAALGHSETMRTLVGASRGYMVDDALCTYLSACIYAPIHIASPAHIGAVN